MLDLAAAQGYCDAIPSILARGADVNAATPSGRTALHCAAFQDQAEAVDTLVACGARVEAADDQGCTALHVASANGACKAIASLLHRGAAMTRLNNDSRTPLLLAVENGRLAAATLLLHTSEEEDGDEGFVDRRYGSDEYSALDLAARGGHTDIFQMLVRHGADVNARDSDGVRALYLAALNDQATMVDLLVKAGAHVGAIALGRQNRTALHAASAEGSSGAVKALVAHGASTIHRDACYLTPLHLAARNGDVTTVKTLLAWGSDPTFFSEDYNVTPLEEASYWGHVSALKAMCSYRGPVITAGRTGVRETLDYARKKSISAAVSIAAKRNHVGAIDVLIEAGGDVNAECALRGTPVHYAAETGAADAIVALARHGADLNKMGRCPGDADAMAEIARRQTDFMNSGGVRSLDLRLLKFKGHRRTALHIVALFGWVRAARALLVAGANPNSRCHYRDDQLHRPLDIASEEGHVEIVRLMVKHRVDIAGADPRNGQTALHVAAASGRVEVVQVLTKAGCSPDLQDGQGCTPLHACVVKNSRDTVDALATAGADINKANAEGNTPLHLASAAPHRLAAVGALLAAGAETTPRNNEDTSALDLAAKAGHVDLIRALIGAGACVNDKDGDGRTALMLAVKANSASAVDELLSAGADVEAHLNAESWTSLHAAAEDSHAGVVRVLLKHGANVHAKDAENDNDSPLHVAVRQAGMEGALEIVKALLRHDADEEARNDNGLTPVSVVGSMGGPDAARAVTALLQRAPGDRAWRRRGLLILCCARAKSTTSSSSAAAATTSISQKEQEQAHKKQLKRTEGGAAAGLPRLNAISQKAEGRDRETTGAAATDAGRNDNFDKVASWLLELQEEGLFRIVVGYL